MREPPATIKHLIWRKHSRKKLCAEAPRGDTNSTFLVPPQHPPSGVISGISTIFGLNIQLSFQLFCILALPSLRFARNAPSFFVTLLI